MIKLAIVVNFSLANLLSCINSSANFLVYMLRGKKFRDAFLVTYGCKIRNRRQGRQGFLTRQQTTGTLEKPNNFLILHKFFMEF